MPKRGALEPGEGMRHFYYFFDFSDWNSLGSPRDGLHSSGKSRRGESRRKGYACYW